mmetsp:Transcript_5369/g.16427  ORF Transcript_5369/g.16427 Transcript_5369/m.16427 type:complete len:163 (-) Transcript_5369:469-957(-)|eukprot:scaffold150850_cov26-Tisochrysis_lutea.AAC.3
MQAHNKVRAFAGWPGTWTLIRMGDGTEPVRAKLLHTRVGAPDMDDSQPPTGEDARRVSFARPTNALRLRCGDGSILEVTRLTLPGKKPVDAKAFWNGLNGRPAWWEVAPSPQEVEAPRQLCEPSGSSTPTHAPDATARSLKRSGAVATEAPPPKGFKWGDTY